MPKKAVTQHVFNRGAVAQAVNNLNAVQAQCRDADSHGGKRASGCRVKRASQP